MRWWGLLCTRPTCLIVGFFLIVLAVNWNNNLWLDLSRLGTHYSDSESPSFSFSPQVCLVSREATNTDFILFGLTRLGLEYTIYHIIHYTTYVVYLERHFRKRTLSGTLVQNMNILCQIYGQTFEFPLYIYSIKFVKTIFKKINFSNYGKILHVRFFLPGSFCLWFLNLSFTPWFGVSRAKQVFLCGGV